MNIALEYYMHVLHSLSVQAQNVFTAWKTIFDIFYDGPFPPKCCNT